MPTYLVGNAEAPFEEKDFVFVVATSEQEARHKYAQQVGIHTSIFQEHTYEKIVNASLAEKFWLQTPEEHNAFNQRGDVIASKSAFKGRVRTFFKTQPQYADIYINHYFGEAEYPNIQPFPEAMLVHIWLHVKDWMYLVFIDVDHIQTLQ